MAVLALTPYCHPDITVDFVSNIDGDDIAEVRCWGINGNPITLCGHGLLCCGAAWLRLADLGNRPMHCDEAVHAVEFGQLLEDHEYVYDPFEYHGPSLNYFTLPVAWLASAHESVIKWTKPSRSNARARSAWSVR